MKLKEITFILENCDSITIDGKYIGDFVVQDIHTVIQRIACNAINKIEIANEVAIEIHKDANKERYEFGLEKCKRMTFDRLTDYPDITNIEFELIDDYSDGEETPHVEKYDYCVCWVGRNDAINEAQKDYISKDGNLYIVIADSKGIDDFFNKNDIDDSEYMDFSFSMYGVGDKNANA